MPGSSGWLGDSGGTSKIDGKLMIHAQGAGSNAVNLLGAGTQMTIGADSSLSSTQGPGVLLQGTPTFSAGSGLTVDALDAFVLTAATTTMSLTQTQVTAQDKIWLATGGGATQFNGHAGKYQGSSAVDAGTTLNLTLDTAAQWILTGDSSYTQLSLDSGAIYQVSGANRTVTGLLVNRAGVVDLSGNSPQVSDTFTTVGSYSGGGQIRLDTALGDSSSPTDIFVVNGDVSGVTTLDVRNAGGVGAATTGNGIPVVRVTGMAPAGSFALATGQVTAGSYTYVLNQVGDTWYLQSKALPTESSVTCAPLELNDADNQVSACTIRLSQPAPAQGLTVHLALPQASSRYSTTCTPSMLVPAGATTLNCTITATPNTAVGDGNVVATLAINPPTAAGTYTVAGAPAVITVRDDDQTTPPVSNGNATPVPTLGQWALTLLSLVLAGFAAVRLRRVWAH
ncbi:IPTL-CTERM sorting domain-containing protein [Diaphorobacter aerolatus]|uniref:IPTL-CTERM sorting domain-containing protein n=1 Tax=Diaphorobacter aerolatus TaxID=1288495 RepID=A0A7H0GQM9_9BURK|nr:IPTL-CTERM sorting domain-containing protein [Diaphorobacter aerolatus]QNP50595.1 IPTL-CTERM sorting domain-containing protein [Diaphorobacter aerolatus]